ncbi:hypothetical protein ACRAQ7_13225 [Erythrobacter sp. W53]|uniref:hypothetical protein n=1 Tax=Erythrobacter sp. W53 TaxID=3425947 RepID=UPI003D7675C6
MDLNELLHAHRIKVMQASVARDHPGKSNHFAKVAHYAEEIRAVRSGQHTADPLPNTNSGDTIIYGTYAGDPAPDTPMASLNSWESEGGSLFPAQVPFPSGLTPKLIHRFFAGPYTDSDFSDAHEGLARHAGDDRTSD